MGVLVDNRLSFLVSELSDAHKIPKNTVAGVIKTYLKGLGTSGVRAKEEETMFYEIGSHTRRSAYNHSRRISMDYGISFAATNVIIKEYLRFLVPTRIGTKDQVTKVVLPGVLNISVYREESGDVKIWGRVSNVFRTRLKALDFSGVKEEKAELERIVIDELATLTVYLDEQGEEPTVYARVSDAFRSRMRGQTA